MSRSIDEEEQITGILGKKLVVINLGVSTFADDLEKQGVKVLSIDWKPPAEGDKEMMKLLDKLGY